MYKELVKQCRGCLDSLCGECKYEHLQNAGNFVKCMNALLGEAADAIDKQNVIISGLNETIKMYVNETPQWIPVTERLPDEYVSVLCYCSRNDQYGCGEWCKEDNGTIYWAGLYGMIPTHWMPLPEPPKEET